MVTVDEVTRELEKVVDPEIGLPITEMHLVDEITIKEDGEIFIKYHLTAPFCPPIFAEDIGVNIRQLTSKLNGVRKVTVILHGHALANEINQRVNPDYSLRPVRPRNGQREVTSSNRTAKEIRADDPRGKRPHIDNLRLVSPRTRAGPS